MCFCCVLCAIPNQTHTHQHAPPPLREEAKAEKERLRAEKKLTFNQKEKRKRDAGMAERGKNFVEEEKRIQRNFGMYSGFD
jgi:hypothetical protein